MNKILSIIKSIGYCSLVSVICSSPVVADQSKHKIDTEMQNCLDESGYLHNQKACILNAERQWDKKLNQSYKILMSQINTQKREVVRQAQRDWIRYRDSQIHAIQEIYDGTWEIAELARITFQMELTMHKALELSRFASERKSGDYSYDN